VLDRICGVGAAAGALLLSSFLPCAAQSVSTLDSKTVRGVVSSIDGKYSMKVHDRYGVITKIRLRSGTIIRPNGLTLRPGMRVSVIGIERHAGASLDAREIDAPYHFVSMAVSPSYSPFMGFSYLSGTPIRRKVLEPNS
jgi:hypothetical protein